MADDSLLIAACSLAAEKHRDQRRKDEYVSPYINHPLKVAALLADVAKVTDSEILAAAVLHDVLEDTPTPADELEKRFGQRVAGWVLEVTDERGLSTKERRARQVAKVPHLSHPARLIKIADKISNVHDRARHSASTMTLAEIQDYLDFSEEVVRACAGTHAELEEYFFDELNRGRHHIASVVRVVRPA